MPSSGLLVTNQLNLMYMLAAGLLMPPAGFASKYYRDTLACSNGWLPFFVDKVPATAVYAATDEAEYLRPVVVEVDLTGLSGPVRAHCHGELRELRFPEQLDGREQVVFVPAPLPTSWINGIYHASMADKRACQDEAKDFGNVPISDFKNRTKKGLFVSASAAAWPPVQVPRERATPLQEPLAAGGAMAMLLQFGNLGNLAVQCCRAAFDPQVVDWEIPHDTLTCIPEWFQTGESPPNPNAPSLDRKGHRDVAMSGLFWGAVAQLQGSPGEHGPPSVLLDYLADAAASLEPQLQSGVRRLHTTLTSLTGLADATASELFERHHAPMSRALILCLLRDDCQDLLAFNDDHLQEPDWLMAAILFGARDGWLRLPLGVRSLPGLSAAVSHRMASMSHRLAKTDVRLGEEPPRVRPIRELLGESSGWQRRENAMALEVARSQGWDCIHTRVSLRRGSYTLSIANGSAHIDIGGEPRITAAIDAPRFFQHLTRSRLDQKTEAKLRKRWRD